MVILQSETPQFIIFLFFYCSRYCLLLQSTASSNGNFSKISFHCAFICISSVAEPHSGTHAVKPNFLQRKGCSLNSSLELKHKTDLCPKPTLKHTHSTYYTVLFIFMPNIRGYPRPVLFSLCCITQLKMREITLNYLLSKAQDDAKTSQK